MPSLSTLKGFVPVARWLTGRSLRVQPHIISRQGCNHTSNCQASSKWTRHTLGRKSSSCMIISRRSVGYSECTADRPNWQCFTSWKRRHRQWSTPSSNATWSLAALWWPTCTHCMLTLPSQHPNLQVMASTICGLIIRKSMCIRNSNSFTLWLWKTIGCASNTITRA